MPGMNRHAHRIPVLRRLVVRAALCAGVGVLGGCITTEFEAKPSFPAPLVTRIPVAVGVYLSPEFRDKVFREDREGGDYVIALGKAQSEGFMRLMTAMFDRAVPVPSTDAAARTDAGLRGVIEPVLLDFAFVTPADSGTGIYAVSIKYRVNGYRPDGQLIDSWTFTGYGTAENESIVPAGSATLQRATALAMRDAAAKIATEFREQAVVRGLLPESGQAPTPAEVATPTP
jgi:hypothetical protein